MKVLSMATEVLENKEKTNFLQTKEKAFQVVSDDVIGGFRLKEIFGQVFRAVLVVVFVIHIGNAS